MSMNLHCNLVDLWQTPTYITKMCLVNEKGTVIPVKVVTGIRAQQALQIYIQWVLGTLNGVWNSDVELEEERERINEHVAEVRSVLNDQYLQVFML